MENRIAGTDDNGVPATWDGLTGGNVVRYHMPFENPSIGIADLRWSPNGAEVAFSYLNGIAVFNARTAALLESLPLLQKNQSFQGLSWSPDGKSLVTLRVMVVKGQGTKNETLTNQLDVWDLSTNRAVAQPASNLISNIAWSPDGRYLATWSTEGAMQTLTLWNPITWQIARAYSGVVDFSWSPDGSMMSIAKDGRVQIVDATSGKTLRSFGDGNGIVSSVAWQPGGLNVLVGTYDMRSNTAYLSLWNTQTGTEVFAFKTFQGWSDGPSA